MEALVAFSFWSRAIVCVYGMMAFIVMATYTANLSAFLTNRVWETKIEAHADIMNGKERVLTTSLYVPWLKDMKITATAENGVFRSGCKTTTSFHLVGTSATKVPIIIQHFFSKIVGWLQCL